MWDDGSSLMASAFETWALVIFFQGCWHALGGSDEDGVRHLFAGEKLMALAQADVFLWLHGDKNAAAKSKTWLNLPATPNQLRFLGLEPMASIGLDRYTAACQLTWKFSQAAIRKKLEGAGMRVDA